MSEKEQPPIMDQKLCVNGCGFFGSSNTSHMCSKCWKDTMSQSMLDAEGKKDGGMEKEPVPTPPPAAKTTFAAPEPSQSTMGVTSSPRPLDVIVPPQPPSTAAVAAVPAAAAATAAATAPALPLSPVSFSAGGGASASSSAGVVHAVGAVMAGAAGAAGAAAGSPALPVQVNRKRCFACSKKVGYTGIACRCNYVFCSLHRYPDQHDCAFDFKTSDRNDLKRTVVGGGQFSKVDRL